MDWLKNLLLSQGLSEEQTQAIVEELERSYVPKIRFDEMSDARRAAEESLKERDKQMADLKLAAGDNAELNKQIELLQANSKLAMEKYDADWKALRMNTALKLALAGQAYDPDIVIGLLDLTKIELDDNGNIRTGLDGQLKALRESKAFLFAPSGKEQLQFKGMRPADSKDGKDIGGGAQGDFGKRLAEFAKQKEGLDKARASYFD